MAIRKHFRLGTGYGLSLMVSWWFFFFLRSVKFGKLASADMPEPQSKSSTPRDPPRTLSLQSKSNTAIDPPRVLCLLRLPAEAKLACALSEIRSRGWVYVAHNRARTHLYISQSLSTLASAINHQLRDRMDHVHASNLCQCARGTLKKNNHKGWCVRRFRLSELSKKSELFSATECNARYLVTRRPDHYRFDVVK